MELGGDIDLEGFDGLEPALLVVVKKMVGNYAKKMKEAVNFTKLKVIKHNSGVEAALSLEGREIKASAEHNNLFFSLDKALTEIIGKLK